MHFNLATLFATLAVVATAVEGRPTLSSRATTCYASKANADCVAGAALAADCCATKVKSIADGLACAKQGVDNVAVCNKIASGKTCNADSFYQDCCYRLFQPVGAGPEGPKCVVPIIIQHKA